MIQTPSSSATTGISVLTSGPSALYCLMTISVAAGAVAHAIEPIASANGNDSPSKSITTVTRNKATNASSIVIINIALPTLFKSSNFSSAPMEKAMKAKATSLMISKFLTASAGISPKTEGPMSIPAI